MMFTHGDHVGVYGKCYSDNQTRNQVVRVEVSHTLDGYWILSGYTNSEYQEAQTIMAKAKEQFIEANPLIDSAKVVVVNGEFKQPINKSLASMIIDGANSECVGD
ncbi:Sporulation protein YpeB [Lactiplantibacillus plantarum]|nr:Sporulation protein YpeB [Lactiplantibacillus plantarum]